MNQVELHAVGKCYTQGKNSVTALENISFSLALGEFVGVQGPSGSGKSTLLHICGLLDSASSGSHRMGGKDIQRLAAYERCALRRQHIGFIFQHHQLLPALTVYDNIAYPLFLNGMTSGQIKQRVGDMLQRIGLHPRRHHLPRQLSGGECQRVGIARALIKRPQLVIADEPSASLDHTQVSIGLALMRELNAANGATFIIASHDDAVINHCDRKIVLRDGRLVPDA